ncbi:hypothetical protein [Streptomyces sp. NPDC058579]
MDSAVIFEHLALGAGCSAHMTLEAPACGHQRGLVSAVSTTAWTRHP